MNRMIKFILVSVLALGSLQAGTPKLDSFGNASQPNPDNFLETLEAEQKRVLKVLEEGKVSTIVPAQVTLADGRTEDFYVLRIEDIEAVLWPISSKDPMRPYFKALAYRLSEGDGSVKPTIIRTIKTPHTNESIPGAVQFLQIHKNEKLPTKATFKLEAYNQFHTIPRALVFIMGLFKQTPEFIEPKIYTDCSPKLKDALKKLDSESLTRHISKVKLDTLLGTRVPEYGKVVLKRRDQLLAAGGESAESVEELIFIEY